jgi:hypothetical protein
MMYDPPMRLARFRPGLLRLIALTLAAAVLMLRAGPMCGGMAQAAPVPAMAMADCVDQAPAAPAKKAPPAACTMSCAVCAALDAAPLATPTLFAEAPPAAWPARDLSGLSPAPATPPPQRV